MTFDRFEFGAARPVALRRERVEMLGLARPVRLLFASDLHLGNRWSGVVIDEVTRIACSDAWDTIVLGGDLADSHAGLRPLRRLLAGLSRIAPTFAVLGNHDCWCGGALAHRALRATGVEILAGRPVDVGGASVVGGITGDAPPDRTVLCAHDPAIYLAARTRGVRLTLAGHLHGGQCVLFERDACQWPGRLLNALTLTRRDDGASTLLVSRGVADTLPVRWNCPREVIGVELHPPGGTGSGNVGESLPASTDACT